MPRPKIDRSSLKPATRRSDSIAEHVVPIADLKDPKGGVKFEKFPSGLIKCLSIVMPIKDNPWKGDLNASADWIRSTRLAIPFAEALFIAMSAKSARTFRRSFYQLDHFFKFLRAEGSDSLGIDQISNELVARYIKYLIHTFKSSDTRRHCFGTLKAVVAVLQKLKPYSQIVSSTLSMPINPWGKGSGLRKKRSGIPIAELVRIEQACLIEISSIIRKIEAGSKLILSCEHNDRADWGETTNLAQTLFAAKKYFDGYIPSLNSADSLSSSLGRGIRNAGGLNEIWSYLHLTSRTLIPFVVLLCIRTAFNSETCIAISRHCVRESPLLVGNLEVSGSDRRHRVRGKKNRARHVQVRTYAANDNSIENPVNIVRMVVELTALIRHAVDPKYIDRLFIYPSTKFSVVRGFAMSDGTNFGNQLKSFIADNSLVQFTLSNIRPTIDEILDIMTDGDIIKKQAILNHRHSSTTDDHYTSDNSKNRRRERLGEYQNQRDRWVASGGRSDPRQSDMEGTRRAATGGFECADPYDSPIVGEVPGRLCQSWGSCPTCWMAGINPDDPYSLARIIQLEASIELARSSVSASRWFAHWLPILQAIQSVWLPMFKRSSVWEEAAAIRLVPLLIIE